MAKICFQVMLIIGLKSHRLNCQMIVFQISYFCIMIIYFFSWFSNWLVYFQDWRQSNSLDPKNFSYNRSNFDSCWILWSYTKTQMHFCEFIDLRVCYIIKFQIILGQVYFFFLFLNAFNLMLWNFQFIALGWDGFLILSSSRSCKVILFVQYLSAAWQHIQY